MNLNFIDVSSSFVNMVQKDVSNKVMASADTKSGERQIFAEKFKKTLEEANRPLKESNRPINDSPPVKDRTKEPVVQDQEKIISFLLEKLNKSNGAEFTSSLKTVFLMLSKGDLNNISIDAEGLDALKKILLKAGFKETDVNELIAEFETKFEENMDNGKLVLDELMDKLFELSFENKVADETDPETFIASSALPFIESILISMAVPNDQIQEILTASDKGEQGISLDVLIEKLQQLQKKSFYTNQDFKTIDGDNNFKQIIKQLDLETDKSNPSVLMFNDLVSALEKLRDKQTSVHKATNSLFSMDQNKNAQQNETPEDLLKAMFKGIEIKEKTPEKQILEISKSHLLNPTDLSIDAEKVVSHLFNDKQTQNGKNKKLQAGIGKDTANLDKSIQPSVVNAILKGTVEEKAGDDKLNFKQPKSKIATSELSQVSISDTKTGDSTTNLNLLKSKASLKNLPTYVTNQVGKSIVRAANQGENVLKIQLKPSALGRLTMTIDNSGNSIKVSIITETHAAKEILTSNISEIRTVLSNSGVNLERFDVDMNSGFKQSMADAKNPAGNNEKQRRNKNKMSVNGINGEKMNDSSDQINGLKHDGALHFVA